MVDVLSRIEIARPRAEVAAYVLDQDTAPQWYDNIRSVEWKSPPPVEVGARFVFVARFLGSRLEYTYEVRELVAGERFVMSTSDGPFEMRTTYTWEDAPGGATIMTLRNEGEPSSLSKLSAPLVAKAMARANRRDLRKLKRILEGG
jgi:uncharacterized membrane protein